MSMLSEPNYIKVTQSNSQSHPPLSQLTLGNLQKAGVHMASPQEACGCPSHCERLPRRLSHPALLSSISSAPFLLTAHLSGGMSMSVVIWETSSTSIPCTALCAMLTPAPCEGA